MYQALYRKWRPSTFDDVAGQEHITSILENEVENGKLSHAYLFCGPRGTGKTTCAKIISKAANCEHPVHGNPCGKCPSCISISEGTATDVIEMDAASNNGVDNIRDLRDSIVYTPADLKYRVYIIDEVHMLSPSAFNALLKTLEEPPSHVIFILATTELQKIPATVLSRCQRFDFRRITPQAIISRMKTVCEGEGIKADDASLELIARLAQGALRDALNMIEYCAGGGNEINIKTSVELLGASPVELLSKTCESIAMRDVTSALGQLDEVYHSSRDISVFWRELIGFCRDMMLSLATRGSYNCDAVTKKTAEYFNVSRLIYILDTFTGTENDMSRLPSNAKLYAEMAIVRVCDKTLDMGLSALQARVTAIEERLSAPPAAALAAAGAPRRASGADAPAPALQAAPAEAGASAAVRPVRTAAAQAAPAQAPEQPLKARDYIRSWADIIRKIEQKDISTSSFLKGSDAYNEAGKLHIRCDSGFAVMMLSSDEKKRIIASAVNFELEKSLGISDIIFEEAPVKEKHEPIEDLIETEEMDMKARIPQGPSMNEMLRQAQKMQEDMASKQAELEAREYDISAGGGVVKIKINGKKEIVSMTIDPVIVDADDVETMTDIITAAVNEAIRTVEDTSAKEMEKITGASGMGMPGLF